MKVKKEAQEVRVVESEKNSTHFTIADLEDGGRDLRVKACGQLPQAGQGKKMDSPLEPPKMSIAMMTH